jgi:hypothetical protein
LLFTCEVFYFSRISKKNSGIPALFLGPIAKVIGIHYYTYLQPAEAPFKAVRIAVSELPSLPL